jgi:hypothetical protein
VQPGSSIAISITELPRECIPQHSNTPTETVNYTILRPNFTIIRSRKLQISNHEARQVRQSKDLGKTAANGCAQVPYEVSE